MAVLCNVTHSIHDCDQQRSPMGFLKAAVLKAKRKINTYKVITPRGSGGQSPSGIYMSMLK